LTLLEKKRERERIIITKERDLIINRSITHEGESNISTCSQIHMLAERAKKDRKLKGLMMMMLIGDWMKMEKVVGLGEFVHERENAGMAVAGMADSLSLELTQLGA
jgi:hypothetical protein